MKRRDVLAALGATALTAPFHLLAQQQSKVWRVGYLTSRGRPINLSENYAEFVNAMRDLGYVEGKNLLIEWRFANSMTERLAELAVELVKAKVDVIVTAGTPSTIAAQKATTTIPIVMANVADPLGSGLVANLARPEGNTTGLSDIAVDLGPKLFELLLSIAPKLSVVGVLVQPINPSHVTTLNRIRLAAQSVNVKVVVANAQFPGDLDSAFTKLVHEHAEAVIVAQDAMFSESRQKIADLAKKYRRLSIAAYKSYVEAGMLMSYGQDPLENFRRAAIYVDKIFKGAKVGELPVEQPMQFRLYVNSRTARELNLLVPQSILVRADKVIE